MTKKSEGRILRDTQRKNAVAIAEDVQKFNGRVKEVASRDGWEALATAYCNIVEVCDKHLVFAEVLRNEELMKFVDDRISLMKRIHSMMTDLTRIVNAARATFAQHGERRGDWGDEWPAAVQFMDVYNGLLFEYTSLVQPLAAQVAETVALAEVKMEQMAQAARDEATVGNTDVNVISDVIINESVKGQ